MNTADETAIRAIVFQMADAWNQGSAEAFAAPFSETADFIAFEGTHLKGRGQITAFHREIFATVVKGSRIEAEVKFVRFLGPEMAILHSAVRVTLQGRTEPSPGRDSMQLFLVTKCDGDWRAEAIMNARRVTLAHQSFSDDLDSLSPDGQRQVWDLVASLKQL